MKSRTLSIIAFIASASALLIAGSEYLHLTDSIMNWLRERFGGITGSYSAGQADTANDGYNNPGNIRAGGETFAGENTPAGNTFKTFVDLQHGYRAMLHILATYSNNGFKTPRQMITRWAPPSENNTEAYINAVVIQSNVSPDLPLFETYTDNVVKDFIAAMAHHEQGNNFVVNEQHINEGFLLA